MNNERHIEELLELMQSAYKEKRYLDLADYYDEYQICKEVKMAYEHTYFSDLPEDLTLKIPKPVIDEMELDNEPCLVSKPFDDILSISKMYEGATVASFKLQEDFHKQMIEMIQIPKNRVLQLKKEWIDQIGLKVGDLILLTSFDESFNIQRFDISKEIFID